MKKPDHLHAGAINKYDELYKIVGPIMKDGDENLLAVLANCYLYHKQAAEVLNDRGPIMAGETMTRKNPAFDVVKETEKMIESLSAHFGLSPKSRGDSLTIVKKVDDDIDKLMK